MIVAATDLSSRSDRAVHRAALLACQFEARLALLHVVDDDQPADVVDRQVRQAEMLLDGYANRLADVAGAESEVLVRLGNPFHAIVETAKERAASLVVMGTHRKRILRDIFVGTTVERVVRTGPTPVLMVNAYPGGPYRRVVLATDMSEASGQAAQAACASGKIAGISPRRRGVHPACLSVLRRRVPGVDGGRQGRDRGARRCA
jgi:nucleotide-binding universal stress UspA family protein